MDHENAARRHSGGPFDESASERLRRMGLLTEDEKPDRDAIAVASRLYAGAFYDDLYDFYGDMDHVNSVCQDLMDLIGSDDVRMPFLSICSAYDAIYRPLPAPIWWMAGNLEVAAQFAGSFLRRLSEFNEETG